MFPTQANAMGGPSEVEIDNVVIGAEFIGEITPSVTPVLRTSERQSGTTTRPTSLLDNPEYSFPLYLNSYQDLQYIFPDAWDGSAIVAGTETCSLPDPVEVVFRGKCSPTGDTVTMPAAYVTFEDNLARNGTDDRGVTVHVYPQPNAQGQVRYGSDGSSS